MMASDISEQNEFFVLASSRSWNIAAFQLARSKLAGRWSIVTDPADLETAVSMLPTRYVFFPHWSQIVPSHLLEQAECVCFHMTDVPYGRGGSPLQNLISRGKTETVISALRMVRDLDAGPVYIKRPLSLHGSAQEIFQRAADEIMDMIDFIVRNKPDPVPQEGVPILFARRKPEDSLIPTDTSLEELYDHIRMLDADGYPNAYVDHGHWRVRFSAARRDGGCLEARARFSKKEEL